MTTSPALTTRLRAAVAAVLAAGAVGLGLFVTDDPRSGVEALTPQTGSSGTSLSGTSSAGTSSAGTSPYQQGAAG
jgi:hypothetical protein